MEASCRDSTRLPRTNSPDHVGDTLDGIDRWIEGGRSRSSSLSSPFRNSSSVFLLRSKSGHGGACDRSQKSPGDTRERERERAEGSTRATFSRCWPYKASSGCSGLPLEILCRPDLFFRTDSRGLFVAGTESAGPIWTDSETGRRSLEEGLVRVVEHRGEEFLR